MIARNDRSEISRSVNSLSAMTCKPQSGLPRLCDHPKYREINIIERMFCWLKECWRFGSRDGKKLSAMISLFLHAAMPKAVLSVQNLIKKIKADAF